LVSDEQENRFLARPISFVQHVDLRLDGIALSDAVWRDTQVRENAAPVREPMSERVQRIVRDIEVFAGEVVVPIEWSPAGPLGEEDGHLAQRARPGDYGARARRHA